MNGGTIATIIIAGCIALQAATNIYLADSSRAWQFAIQKDIFTYCPGPAREAK